MQLFQVLYQIETVARPNSSGHGRSKQQPVQTIGNDVAVTASRRRRNRTPTEPNLEPPLPNVTPGALPSPNPIEPTTRSHSGSHGDPIWSHTPLSPSTHLPSSPTTKQPQAQHQSNNKAYSRRRGRTPKKKKKERNKKEERKKEIKKERQ
jgi:hypothetical protein